MGALIFSASLSTCSRGKDAKKIDKIAQLAVSFLNSARVWICSAPRLR